MSAPTFIVAFIAGIAFSIAISLGSRKSIKDRHSKADDRYLRLAKTSATSLGRSLFAGQIIMAIALAFFFLPIFRENDFLLGGLLFCFIAAIGVRVMVRNIRDSAVAEIEHRKETKTIEPAVPVYGGESGGSGMNRPI